MAEMDQGFDYKNVVSVTIPPETRGQLQALKEECLEAYRTVNQTGTSGKPIRLEYQIVI